MAGRPGVTASLAGKPLEGRWYNRTREYGERQRGEVVDAEAWATDEVLVLSPLPCWADLTDEVIGERVADLAEQALAAYRDAAEKLKEGDREAVFPEGAFPPGLPFVAFSCRGQPA